MNLEFSDLWPQPTRITQGVIELATWDMLTEERNHGFVRGPSFLEELVKVTHCGVCGQHSDIQPLVRADAPEPKLVCPRCI